MLLSGKFNSKVYWSHELKTLLKICQQLPMALEIKIKMPEVAYETLRVCQPLQHFPCCPPPNSHCPLSSVSWAEEVQVSLPGILLTSHSIFIVYS